MSSDIILIADVKGAASCGQSLYSCFGGAVSVAVKLVIKRHQDSTFRSGFQMADVPITVIDIIRLYAVSIVDVLNAVKAVIAILHIHALSAVDAGHSAQKVIFVAGADACGVFDLCDVSCAVVSIGDQKFSVRALFFQISMAVIGILVGVSVAYGMYQPAKAVIVPCADIGIFSACIGCFLIHRIAKDVVNALHLPAVAVCVACQIAFFIILEGFFIAELVCALPDFAEAVITVLNGIAVSVDGPAYLSCVVVLVTFFYAV